MEEHEMETGVYRYICMGYIGFLTVLLSVCKCVNKVTCGCFKWLRNTMRAVVKTTVALLNILAPHAEDPTSNHIIMTTLHMARVLNFPVWGLCGFVVKFVLSH